MSAPQIPNLHALRRGAGRGRGRGRGTNDAVAEESHGVHSIGKDRIIQSTDNDAATSRLSAVDAGYLNDAFAKMFTHSGIVDRRLPLMNRGTYVRTTAIDRLVNGFLSGNTNTRQIISLGSGSDTRFFRLRQEHPDVSLIYHEFDFPINTAAKIRYMKMPPFMQSVKRHCDIDLASEYAAFSVDEGGNESVCLKTQQYTYRLHPLDLRTLAGPCRTREQVHQDCSRFQISTDVPTLVLSECCLIYLPPGDADSVLSYFISAVYPTTSIGVVIYEPIRPHDAFGRTMVTNLTARGIHLQTLNAHDTLGAQKERLRKHGLGSTKGGVAEGAEAADVDFIWQAWIEETEKERVVKLEWMDEVEEWSLLARHYCVAWGWRDAPDEKEKSGFSTWAQLPVQDEEG